MRSFIFAFYVALALGWLHAQGPAWQPSPGRTQIPIWPGKPPGTRPDLGTESTEPGKGPVAGRPWLQAHNVSRPTITVYSPKGRNTGAAVLVFPGGGYQLLAMDLEGTEVCDWLTSRGIACVLLKYRVPNSGPSWDQRCGCDRDTKSSMRAAEWHIDPHKIGVLGFSAGGHLSAAISTHFDERLYPAVDAADKVSCRPDFAVLLYPGHLWTGDWTLDLNPEIRPTTDTPPTFILQAEDDPTDDVKESLVYYVALKNTKVPAEMHLYPQGGHGFGLRRTNLPITGWPQFVEEWLGMIGMISK